MKKTIVLTFPPDYDGELHIQVEKKVDAVGAVFSYSFEIRAGSEDTAKEVLCNAAKDILAALDKKR